MSVLSNAAKEAFLTGQLNWSAGSTDTFMAVLVNDDFDHTDEAAFAAATDVTNLTGWSTAQAAQEELDITTDGAGTATVVGGSTLFQNVPGTPPKPINSVIIYVQNSGMPVALINDGINLGVTPNGGDITIYWNNNSGAGEVFRL